MKIDKATRNEFEDRRKELHKEWQEKVKEYMAKETWQEYIKEAKSLRLPVTNLLLQKKKVIKRLKNGIKVMPMPSKPANYPTKPPTAFKLFVAEKRSEVTDVSQLAELWNQLDAEGKAKYEAEHAELQKGFEQELVDFQKSDDGKKYYREVRGVLSRRKIALAKVKFLGDRPKKPHGAVKHFEVTQLEQIKKEQPSLKGFEIKKLIREKWLGMEAAEKEPLIAQERTRYQEYQAAMEEYKKTENWKGYVKAVKPKGKKKVVRKAKGKAKGKAKVALPPPPEGMPVKPPSAFKTFCTEMTGKSMGLAQLHEAFKALPEEERKKKDDDAREAFSKYTEEVTTFNNTQAGKKYRNAVAVAQKRVRIQAMKTKLLAGTEAPKRAAGAFMLFIADKRSEVTQANPELKGMGAITTKLAELWKGLSEEEKQPYAAKEQQQKEEYEKAMETYRESEGYKKFQAFERRVSKKPQGKAKAKAKAKPSGPERPEGLPKKPPNAFFLWCQSTPGGARGAGKEATWRELGAEGQKQWNEEAQSKLREYEAQLDEFKKSVEGKKFFRLKAQSEKNARAKQVKDKFLKAPDAPKEPHRPLSAYLFFVQEKKSSFSGDMGSVSKQLTAAWSELPQEEKKVFEDKSAEQKVQYDQDMIDYKNSAAYKGYQASLKRIKGSSSKPKSKPKAAAKGKVVKAKKATKAKAKPKAKGRGKKAAAADSDSDVMGSDSSDSDSDSDSD